MKNRLPSIASLLFCTLVLLLLFDPSTPQVAQAKAVSLPTPLPLTCSGPPSTICAYGYVYWDSTPVSGASVKIESLYGTLNTTTASGGLSSSPYYSATLSGSLLVSPGDTITVTGTYRGSSANNVYVAAEKGQQVDIFIPSSIMFGDGTDGQLTVTPGTPVSVNTTSTPVNATSVSGSTSLSVASSVGFASGKEVLIHQSQGTGIGMYDFRAILAVASGVLTFTQPLTNVYTAGGNSHAQVILVPHYTDVTVQGSATLTAPAWNGSTGGILIYRASGTTTINGTLTVTGIGFMGGAGNFANDGYQGEGQVGTGSISTNANGNAGGGGRSGYDDGGGGGGGANGSDGNNGQSGSGGLNQGAAGQRGLTAGSADLSVAPFGGGGGAGGGRNGWAGGSGGQGGGLTLINSKSISVNGAVHANGADGASFSTVFGGGGGGGAGGSILLRGQTISLGSLLVTASSGAGAQESQSGTGGNGSAGRIRVEYVNSVSGTTSPTASTQQLTFTSIPIPTNNTIYPAVVGQAPGSIITFRGQAGLADLSGATITDYVWRSDIDNLLSTSASFTRSASSLTAGTHNIFLKAKDSNNNFSDEVSRQLVILPVHVLYLPFIRR